MAVHHLTLRQLRAVSAVYASRRIAIAADRMNVTQSAVSVLLSQAESALGTRLFDRTTRSLAPTPAIEQIIGIVERMLGDLETLGSIISDLDGLERGQIRVAATPATGIALLPDTVRRFRATYPAVRLILDDCAPNQFYSTIRDEKADFGIGTPPVDMTEFDRIILHDDPLFLVCPRDHPLAQRDHVPWKALSDEPLIVSRRDYGVRELVERTLQDVGGKLRVANEIGFLYSASWLASCGMGLCIFPEHLARAVRDPDLVWRPLVDPLVTRPAAVITRRGRTLSPASERFISILCENLRNPGDLQADL